MSTEHKWKQNEAIAFSLPSAWWTHSETNAWAGLFVHQDRIVLESVRGHSQPFRFATQPIDAALALTPNERIVTLQSVIERLNQAHDDEETEAASRDDDRLDCLQFIRADIAALPYEDGKFDTVFGLSVLQQLNTEAAQEALDEFRRVMKDGGMLVLTFDSGFANFSSFARMVRACGYSFVGEFDSVIPSEPDNGTSPSRLYAFRAECPYTAG